MKTVVMTLMWGNAWERYGRTFVETFAKHWPPSIDLRVVADRDLPIDPEWLIPLDRSPDYHEFMLQPGWGRDPRANGRAVQPWWKPAHREKGYSWQYDARKWMPQGVAPALVAGMLDDGDLLIWLDADVETFAAVPEGFAEALLGNASIVHLGRPGKWSEIGFWACRLHEGTRAFVNALARMYSTGRVFDLAQWHSAYVWDRCADEARGAGLEVRNLTPEGRGHVWFQSPLGRYMDHKKGKRKDLGRSPERNAAHV